MRVGVLVSFQILERRVSSFFVNLIFFKVSFFLSLESMHGKGKERGESEWIPSRLRTVSTESDARLELMNREIMA